MNTIFISGYNVSGIKSLEKNVHLSFCKKTLDAQLDLKDYHMKGIYGPVGSGKTALLTSIAILKNILLHPSYLQHPIIQSKLDASIHKKNKELAICVDFFIKKDANRTLYRYALTLGKQENSQYEIIKESVYVKTARSSSIPLKKVFEYCLDQPFYLDPSYATPMVSMFINDVDKRLKNSSLIALSMEKTNKKYAKEEFFKILSGVFSFALQTHVYVESLNYSFLCKEEKMQKEQHMLNKIRVNQNYVKKEDYLAFEATVNQIGAYLKLFKPDLKRIVIRKKENHGVFVCDLWMEYDGYLIAADQESRGIRKLFALYPYFQAMKDGAIVFIDDFDIWIHEVYGLALLTYLLEEGKGQLCFTSNNVAYMDVLKQSKKSIDFLNEKQELRSWITNGNYSPSKLYRARAIEGVDLCIQKDDFKGVF